MPRKAWLLLSLPRCLTSGRCLKNTMILLSHRLELCDIYSSVRVALLTRIPCRRCVAVLPSASRTLLMDVANGYSDADRQRDSTCLGVTLYILDLHCT